MAKHKMTERQKRFADNYLELGKKLVAEHPDDRQDWLDIFYGDIQYWQQLQVRLLRF